MLRWFFVVDNYEKQIQLNKSKILSLVKPLFKLNMSVTVVICIWQLYKTRLRNFRRTGSYGFLSDTLNILIGSTHKDCMSDKLCFCWIDASSNCLCEHMNFDACVFSFTSASLKVHFDQLGFPEASAQPFRTELTTNRNANLIV